MEPNPFTDEERNGPARAGLTPRDVGDAARGAAVDVPASIDRAVLAVARSRARLALGRSRTPLRILYAALPVAAAALLAVVLRTSSPSDRHEKADVEVLERIAREEGASVASLVRVAVAAYVKRRRRS